MYKWIKPFLFLLPPETAHDFTLRVLNFAYQLGCLKSSTSYSPCHVMGLHFPNPIGLAAGLDKNGEYIDALAALGFGFIEIGTITPKPQWGNPKPRLFRLTQEQALINRMGFNNKGVEYVVAQLKKTRFSGILGINIGKNRDTPLDHAVDDYLFGFRRLAPFASYITINISSPNTPALRELQQGELLQTLLRALKKEQMHQQKYVPLVVKIAPDLTIPELKNLADIVLAEKIDGIIATNTTLSREGVEHSPFAKEAGGLSGKPLAARSTQLIQQLHNMVQDRIPIIGCGGVFTKKEAAEKIAVGASLIQIYTGLIYQGTGLITRLI